MSNEVLESFYRQYFQSLPKKFDDIYILHANSGEVYAFLAYLVKAFMKKHGTKSPLLVGTKPYHTDIIKLLVPEMRSIFYNIYLKEPRLNILGDYWEFDGHRIWQMFSPRHFNTVNSNLGHVHYYDEMLKTLDLNREDSKKPIPVISEELKEDTLRIAERAQLNLDKFVIIAPEALTSALMPTTFWDTIIRELSKKGYDVFLNIIGNNIYAKSITANVSLAELFTLSTFAKGVISLRSGISEFLIPTGTKNITISPKFHWSPILTAEQCINAYSIMKLPYVDKDKVFELNPELYETESKLISHIIDIIEH